MLSSRAKIRMALLSVAIISMGAACTSLLYMNHMAKRISTIVERDATIAQLGEDISIKILEARRDEKNFIIYLDSAYVQSNRNTLIDLAQTIVQIEGNEAISKEYAVELDSMKGYLARYEISVGLLVKTFQEDPRALETLQKQILTYEEELKRLAKRGKIETDSLPSWMSGTGFYTFWAGARVSAEKVALIADLRESSQGVQRLAQTMVARARESLAKNGREAVHYGLRAQRNVINLFLATGLLLVYLIFYLPNRVLLPFRRIVRALKAVSRGEADFPFPSIDSRDEFGDLSRAFQNALSELRTYNILKTNKIIDSGKRFRRIMEEIEEGVIFVSPDFKVEHMNGPAKELFLGAEELPGRDVRDIGELWNLAGNMLEDISRTGRVEFRSRSRKKNLKNRMISITPYFDRRGKLETTVIMVKSPE
jgi:methyl-accepting chemotaxis protein